MLKVERLDFISTLWNLSRTTSLVLTGSPGVGKTWTIGQIIRRCKQESRKFLSLAAEDFEVDSIDELKQSIGFKADFFSVLASFGPESLLIIDGLDALRGESSQKAFRDLIRSVVDQVPNCAIVVTIRTFDLQQSPELQELFFDVRNVRRFESITVAPFSDVDLSVAASQIPRLDSVLQESPQNEIRELLRNPFNLRLAVDLLEGGAGVEELSTIHSQVQLLQKYWFMRVEGAPDGLDRKMLLTQVVREMVSRKSLSIREEAAYSREYANAFRGLRSAEVLKESITDRVSFSHNIFFDYAVARLLLDEEEIFVFLSSDSSRLIFFRPSVLHFFHHLWWNDRKLFWSVAFRFFTMSDLPERAKVIPAIAITEASRSLPDIEPLLAGNDGGKFGLALTLRAIQPLGTLQTLRRSLWLDVLEKVSFHIDLEFINELVSLLNIVVQSKVTGEDAQIGAIARRLLLWMWRTAESLQKHQGDQLTGIAAARVMPIVMQLYATDPIASRTIIESALTRLGSQFSSPHDAFWIAHETKHVIDNDPELALAVYEKMFSSPDQSEETTVMGGSPVFTLTSTRKQDFETALYGLQNAFPYFFKVAPIHASKAAIRVTNGEVLTREFAADQRKRQKRFTFPFLKTRASYISDFSEIWDHGSRLYLSVQLLDTVLQGASEMQESDLHEVVTVIAKNAQVAVCWKRLLETAAVNIKSLYPHVRDLLFVPRFLAAPEVAVVVGNVLKAAYGESLPSGSDMAKIEKAIARIPQSRYIKRYEKAESIQNRLLLSIGIEHLLSSELRAQAEETYRKEPTFANEPYVRTRSGAMSYSTEDWLRDQGSDTTKQENKEVLEAIKPVSDFEHKFLNSEPSLQDCLDIEPYLRRLHELIQKGRADENVSSHARGVLYAAAESAVKNSTLSAQQELLGFCKALLLQGADDPVPRFDPQSNDTFDMPSWSSPLPRIEAAQGVSHFLWNFGLDDEVVRAASRLTADKVPAVRYQIAIGLPAFYKHRDEQQFWDLMTRMIDAETTPGVMLGLVGSLGRVAGADPERVVALLARAVNHGLPPTDRTEVIRALVQILTSLYIVRNHAASSEQLARFEADPVLHAGEITNEIFTTSHYLIPNNADSQARSRAHELYRRILSSCYAHLEKAGGIVDLEQRGKSVTALMKHIDEVALRIYFSFDIQPELRTPERTLAEDQRKQLYFELKPLIAALASGGGETKDHRLLPHTAHYLLETFNGVLEFDPSEIIKFAAQTCKAGSAFNYQLDAMAISEVVKLVDSTLADFKDVLKDPSVATALGEILDLFVRAGWPDAVRLTFTLDYAVR